MNRRTFLGAGASAALTAQTGAEWGGPVIDIHLHPRRNGGECSAHVEGIGAARTVLLTNLRDAERAKAEVAAQPGRFVYRRRRTRPYQGILRPCRKRSIPGQRALAK